MFTPLFGSALDFAFKQATPEGKTTICVLVILSIFSWTVIITKARQLIRARKAGKKFFAAYRETRDPMDLARKGLEFDGAPAYELYYSGAEELEYQLKNNPVQVVSVKNMAHGGPTATGVQTDVIARQITTKITPSSFDSVRVALERAASTGVILGKRNDHSLNRRRWRTIYRIAGDGLGRHGNLLRHRQSGIGKSHGHGAGRGGRADRYCHRLVRRDSGHVRLQLYGHEHPGHHAGVGCLRERIRHGARAQIRG